MQKKYVIIVAAGSGNRLESEVPKQFIEINGKPMLLYSLEKFFNYDKEINIFLVLPKNYIAFWQDLAAQYKIIIPYEIVEGGAERFHSVKNALDKITENEGLVAIHDAARPMISAELIKMAFKVAEEYGSALPALAVKDSLRQHVENKWVSADRKKYKIVQTPQVFNLKLLKEAYSQLYKDTFTDDASVYESKGYEVKLIEGEELNIKLTTPADLEYCRYLLERRINL